MANYFKNEEVKGLDKDLVNKLNIAREAAKIPFIINSGFRTPEKSVSVGGFATDPHTKGLGADIRALNSAEVYIIVFGALCAGFKGIGLGKGHVHLDIDPKRDKGVIFVE